MLTKTLKITKLKGKGTKIVREQYLRDDIACRSPLCQKCPSEQRIANEFHLVENATHYAIPCFDIIEKYLEVLEISEIKGLIVLQSVATKVMQSISRRCYDRLLSICRDIRRCNLIFLNEICKETHVERISKDSFDDWLYKCCVKVAEFYASHINESIPIVLITENVELCESFVKCKSVLVCSFKEYLEKMWSEITLAIELYESITVSSMTMNAEDDSKLYTKHLPLEILEAGIKTGKYLKGFLCVNKYNASQEAFVAASKAIEKDTGDIFICGMKDRNRAIHGDDVVIEVLPRAEWKARCLNLVDNPDTSKDEMNDGEKQVMMTGRVVGIYERRWRRYVATLPECEEESNGLKSSERILVIPYDLRIPKIRIVTKQAVKFQNQRIIVSIDNWEINSQYPNGHFISKLGEIGLLETEVQSLLIEHDIFTGEFPQSLVSELPVNTEEEPWTLDDNEVNKRKDIRQTHLVFSIDPQGCEDVDDTLSIRDLPGGLLELGVHIADVTHFVRHMSMVDLEARSRSTSVYLPDRRYDMLPHILSGDLCSLKGNVDRYAVSVLWKMSMKGEVKNVWFGRTVLRSKYKLCYEDAQKILLDHKVEDMLDSIPELNGLSEVDLKIKFEELKNAIIKLNKISSVLRNARLSKGGLELMSINMKFEIDKTLPFVVTDLKSAKELDIHKTVAECMIFANHWVAKKISEVFPHQSVLRQHPHPREVDLIELQKIALMKGFTLNIHSNKELGHSLERAMDPQNPFVNQLLRMLAVRAMIQAAYVCTDSVIVEDLYHYGLGLDKYTHFTSPIRRYADVMVHRLLLAAIGEENENWILKVNEVEKICNHMNIKHKAAQDVEKSTQELFQAFYLEEKISKIGDSPLLVDGIIYFIRANGMLVYVPVYGLKGAVCLRNRDKKVCIPNEDIQWVDGVLEIQESSLVVKTSDGTQKYSIFDHITLSVKVIKSRIHKPKIVLDLVKNEPYIPDISELENEKILPSIHSEIPNEMPENHILETSNENNKQVSMYELLERLRALTLQR